jgi:hypothetical protein
MSRVADYESMGCRRVDKSLGIQSMPHGYALMLDADEMYFFWLREADGAESVVHWNKWAVRKGALLHAITVRKRMAERGGSR